MKNNLLSKPTAKAWQRIGTDPSAGVAVPLFALRSRQSAGVGDVDDLRLLVDWCVQTGQKIIQILPINDIGDQETSPYNALSAMALDPIYISLNKSVKEMKIKDPKIIKAIKTARNELDALPRVNYEKVREAKHRILRMIFHSVIPEPTTNHKSQTTNQLHTFIQTHSSWLHDYALFRVLKKEYGNKAWKDWPKKVRERDAKTLERLRQNHAAELLYHQFLQMILFDQFADSHHYANQKGIFLKGDIPILVSPDSVETWAHPEYFKPGFIAGAPPDMFSEKGQRWGFPVYDWEYLAQTRYQFWADRLQYAENFFDLYRIDHVLGFFRIWTMRQQQSALHGFFDPQIALSRGQLEHHGFSVDELINHHVLVPILNNPDQLAFTWFYWKEPYFGSLPEEKKNCLKHWEQEMIQQQEDFWAGNGRRLLLFMIQASVMLPCAEDLGVVPDCVPRVLEELGIPGLRVLRWTRKWNEDGQPFVSPENQDFISVVTSSVHDSTPLLQWWQEAPQDERNAFWRQFLGWDHEANPDLTPEPYCHFLQQIYHSNSIFVINPLQDILNWSSFFPGSPDQYKVNTPGSIHKNNWSIRYPFFLEELVCHQDLVNSVKNCLENRVK